MRELENKVHHALVLAQGESIEPHDIQLSGGLPTPSLGYDLSRPFRELKREVVEAFESEYVRALLRAHHGNLAAASRQAGMDRKNLWAFARKYRINLKHLRDEKT